MTTDPVVQGILDLIFSTTFLNAIFAVIGGFLSPVFDTVKEPYNNFVHTMLGNLLGIVAK
jgi:hypothetical protein